MNPFDNLLSLSFTIYLNIIKPSTLKHPGGLFQSSSPKHRKHFFFSLACHAHFIPLDSFTLIFRVEDKLWSYSLCNFLQLAPITAFFLGRNIFHGVVFSNTSARVLPLICETPFRIHVKQQSKLYIFYSVPFETK